MNLYDENKYSVDKETLGYREQHDPIFNDAMDECIKCTGKGSLTYKLIHLNEERIKFLEKKLEKTQGYMVLNALIAIILFFALASKW